jgi:hypothetical protein
LKRGGDARSGEGGNVLGGCNMIPPRKKRQEARNDRKSGVGYSHVGNRIKSPPTRFLFPRFFHTFASDYLLSQVRD